mgnify:CR=1 FL=1
MPTTNFFVIRERALDILYPARWTRGTADTSSTASLIKDAAAAFSGAVVDSYDRHWLKIRSTTDGAAPQSEVRQMSEGGYTAANGDFVPQAAFSAAVDAGDTYEVHKWLHPDELDRIINLKMRNLMLPSIFPLSLDLVTSDNNDFEQAISGNAITGWTNNGTCVAANETSIIWRGTRSAKLTHTTVASMYFSRQFGVTVGKQYATSIMARTTEGDSARLRLVDATNSATIDTATTTQLDFVELMFEWTPPSGCRTAEVRLMGVTDADVNYFDDYQTWVPGSHTYRLPSWVTTRNRLIEVVEYPRGSGGPGTADYLAETYGARRLSWNWVDPDYRGTNEVLINVHTGTDRPYILAHRPLDEVSADYVTTTANTVPLATEDVDALVDGVVGTVAERLAGATYGAERDHFEKLARTKGNQYQALVDRMNPDRNTIQKKFSRAYGTI